MTLHVSQQRRQDRPATSSLQADAALRRIIAGWRRTLCTSRRPAPDFVSVHPLPKPQAVRAKGVVMLVLAAAVSVFWVLTSLQPVRGASEEPTGAPMPRLVVHEARGTAGEPMPLGLTIEGRADGAIVTVRGLIQGMSLSNGRAAGGDSWQVSAMDLANTWVGPPLRFVGTVELVAELQLENGGRIIHRQPMRIEWTATNQSVPAQVSTTTAVPETTTTNSIPETVAAPQQNAQGQGAPKASKRVEQHGERTHQKQVVGKATAPIRSTNKVTIPMPEKKPVMTSARQGRSDTPEAPDRQQENHKASQPTQTGEDQAAGQVSNPARGLLGFILPTGRSEPTPKPTNLIGPEGITAAAPSPDKATQQESDEPSPQPVMQNQCDYRGCASAYRSFRASDCTYQPHGGRRRLCEKEPRLKELPRASSQRPIQISAQQCNFTVCARFYRSFNPSDCTYQPHSGGPRRTCDR